MKLSPGEKAPDFEAYDQNNKLHKLQDHKGKWVVLYFYPRDNTPGCTREACSVRDNYEELIKHAVVFGVSGDSIKSHKNFSEKYTLPFPLLADPEKKMLDAYGANNVLFAKRTTFLINPKGYIEKIYEKVNPDKHVSQLLSDLNNVV